MLVFLKASFLIEHFSYYTLMIFLKYYYVILNIAIHTDDTTLYCKCDQTSDLLQRLQVAFELESDQQDTVDWGRK